MAFLGDVLSWFGAHDEAIVHLREALKRDLGERARVVGLLGASLFAVAGATEEVENLLREGAAAHPEFGVDFARALRARGKVVDSVSVLRPLAASGVHGAALQRGNILDDDLDDPRGAQEAYRRGIEAGDAHSAYNLAVLHWRQGDDDEVAYYRVVARAMGDLSGWPE